MTDDVYDTRAKIKIFPSLSLGKYDNLGTRVVNIVCHGHKCNILYMCKMPKYNLYPGKGLILSLIY